MSAIRLPLLVAVSALVLALACACGIARADAPTWQFERVLPPQQPGESDQQHLSRPPISMGAIGDIEFFAPNRGLLITDGNPPSVPAGLWAYNGRVPGPELRIRLGDTLRVRFTNKLSQPTTIHWHGVRVPNAMDGVPSVTQPPDSVGF